MTQTVLELLESSKVIMNVYKGCSCTVSGTKISREKTALFLVVSIFARFYTNICISLLGPTNFAPVINNCARCVHDCLACERGSLYFKIRSLKIV